MPEAAATGGLAVVRSSGVLLAVPAGHRRPTLHDDPALWRTPPLHELRRPVWTRDRIAGMVALRAYLLLSVALLGGRAIASALGH